jgi:hypothetical protein
MKKKLIEKHATYISLFFLHVHLSSLYLNFRNFEQFINEIISYKQSYNSLLAFLLKYVSTLTHVFKTFFTADFCLLLNRKYFI